MSEEQTPSEEVPSQDTTSGFDTEFRFDPRLRRLSKFSYRLACAGPFAFWVMALLYPPTNERALPSPPIQALWWALCLSAPCGAALGAVALLLFRRQSMGHRKLNVSYASAGLIVGTAASLALLVGIPDLNGIRSTNHHDPSRSISCVSNVKQLNLAFIMYAQDYDDQVPLPKSWNDGIEPYTKNSALLRCPQAEEETIPTYAMNRRLSGVLLPSNGLGPTTVILLPRVESPENTVMLFDSIPGKNLAGGQELLPNPPRHGSGGYNIIGFADGHAKQIFPEKIPGLLWNPHLTTIHYGPDTPTGGNSSNRPAPTGK